MIGDNLSDRDKTSAHTATLLVRPCFLADSGSLISATPASQGGTIAPCPRRKIAPCQLYVEATSKTYIILKYILEVWHVTDMTQSVGGAASSSANQNMDTAKRNNNNKNSNKSQQNISQKSCSNISSASEPPLVLLRMNDA